MRRPSLRDLGLAGLVSILSLSAAHAQPAPIIGGSTPTVDQFPSVVMLRVGNGMCTGTLITPEWVLTAAHCILPALVGVGSQAQVTATTRVHFGTINLSQSQGTVVNAVETIPDTTFSLNAIGANDIGLIKLARPVTEFAPTPVNLVTANAPVGLSVTMVGYGATQQGGGGGAGRQFYLEGRTSVGCGSFGHSDTNLLCFSQSDNKGKCQGDSGGPSFATINGRTMVVGVTSFGDRNCAVFGADTRTDVEAEFLKMHVAGLECAMDADCPDARVCFEKRCIAQPFGPGGIGAPCADGSECDSGTCADGPGGKFCSERCTPGGEACPDGFQCLEATGGAGACWADAAIDDGGCCDASGAGAPTMLVGIGAVALGLRRRRPARR